MKLAHLKLRKTLLKPSKMSYLNPPIPPILLLPLLIKLLLLLILSIPFLLQLLILTLLLINLQLLSFLMVSIQILTTLTTPTNPTILQTNLQLNLTLVLLNQNLTQPMTGLQIFLLLKKCNLTKNFKPHFRFNFLLFLKNFFMIFILVKKLSLPPLLNLHSRPHFIILSVSWLGNGQNS